MLNQISKRLIKYGKRFFCTVLTLCSLLVFSSCSEIVPEQEYARAVTLETKQGYQTELLSVAASQTSKNKSDKTKKYAEKILATIVEDDMKDVEKVRAVHDYIVLNTKYDERILDGGTIPKISYSKEGVLFKGKAVCQGYAETFQLLMELLGIKSKLITGTDRKTGIGHAWNMVKLDGDWYHIDVTWDDPVPDQKGKVRYQYFLVNDKAMKADHSWKTKKFPKGNGVKYRYYIYEDVMVESIDHIEEKFMEQYNSGERTITVLYPEEGIPDMNFLMKYDYLLKKDGRKMTVSYHYYEPWRLGDYTVFTVIME